MAKKLSVNVMSVFDYLKKVNGRYVVVKEIKWRSKIFKKTVICGAGFESDGATYAPDIDSFSWVIHDKLKVTRKWYDGSHCANWKASVVIAEILIEEKRYFTAPLWFFGTLVYGYAKQMIKGLS